MWIRCKKPFYVIDVENVYDQRFAKAAAGQAAEAMRECCRFLGMSRRTPGIAAYAARRPAAREPFKPQDMRNLTVYPVCPGPDAADLFLLDKARPAIADGYATLVIASGDHSFAPLAREAAGLGMRVCVIANRDSLSSKLRDAAHDVHYVRPAPRPPRCPKPVSFGCFEAPSFL